MNPIIKIEHQEEVLEYKKIKEAILTIINKAGQDYLFIKIESDYVDFTEKEREEFSRSEKAPLLFTFDFVNIELEGFPVNFNDPDLLLPDSLEFEDGSVESEQGNARYATLYIRHHLEIRKNNISLAKEDGSYILTWSGIVDDINYYDEKAKPNNIYINLPIAVKKYDSVDQYYQIEFRDKLKK